MHVCEKFPAYLLSESHFFFTSNHIIMWKKLARDGQSIVCWFLYYFFLEVGRWKKKREADIEKRLTCVFYYISLDISANNLRWEVRCSLLERWVMIKSNNTDLVRDLDLGHEEGGTPHQSISHAHFQ